ncbi:hypothetical protein Tsp_10186 [Trichinella spiralis]|uniref:hypothetical protein n=1 Tax=Trichinella spiralis TaxID=6334 RepID=UPI0001EFDBD7|nr:hypothetical protein Tsp_10186 [Trichinella spiralis]
MGHDHSKASGAGLPWRLRESGTDNSRSNTSRVVVVNTGQPEQLESEFLTKLKVDSMLSKLRPYPVIKFKQFARLNGDLSQIENLYMQVASISSLLKEVVSLADRVNALLPERNRLPPLSTLIRTEEGTVDLNGPEEQTVIDISANDDAA